MPEILTISQRGQITLPVGVRAKHGLKGGDKIFLEETEAGYLIRAPKKGLLDYAGCLTSAYSVDEEEEMAQAGLSRHVLGGRE
ncbi:MAG: AbrB/MazE/SpoVT family DNA-binding domain-containing protein [Synergistaceae bacterium]|nr:AbrB/MazE/SpoVT family DNA-binding domain-containing protein [Synergistaceae bacterium]